jgi:hypothetical protein
MLLFCCYLIVMCLYAQGIWGLALDSDSGERGDGQVRRQGAVTFACHLIVTLVLCSVSSCLRACWLVKLPTSALAVL